LNPREGWQGWEQYAPFYDWENARTLGRRDVPFWQRVAMAEKGDVLELGCGTGRISFPLARAGVQITGIDRSTAMLARAARRLHHRANSRVPLQLVRGDIRDLPFRAGRFAMVLAPYGVLQSLLRERDLAATLDSVVRVLKRDGLFGVDLVPDVPNWREYKRKVQMRGRTAGGAHLTLIESVRQEPRKHLTIFEQCFVRTQGRKRSEHRFDLTFRTLPLATMVRKIGSVGFEIEGVFGDYRGGPCTQDSEARLIMARRS